MAHTPSTDEITSLLKGASPRLQATGGPRGFIIGSGVAFFALVAVSAFLLYERNPWLFGSIIIFALVSVVLLLVVGLGLIGKPTQVEPSTLSLLLVERLGMFFGSGFASTQELEIAVRLLSGVKPLPPPSGVIDGDACDEKNWRDIPPDEADRLAAEDNAAVERELRRIALNIAESTMRRTIPWSQTKEIETEEERHLKAPAKTENE